MPVAGGRCSMCCDAYTPAVGQGLTLVTEHASFV